MLFGYEVGFADSGDSVPGEEIWGNVVQCVIYRGLVLLPSVS